jgi:hypothetical protein
MLDKELNELKEQVIINLIFSLKLEMIRLISI